MNAQQLKNAILQEAIQGRLVPQDPNDEPASVLLDRIRKEKAKLVKEGKLKKIDLEEKPISEEEIPFEIPNSWEWVRLNHIAEVKSSKRVFEKDYVTSGIPFFRSKEIGDLSRGEKIQTELYITKKHYFELKEKYGIPQKGDIFLTSVGSIGNFWICDGREFYYKDGNVTQICANEQFNSRFITLFLGSQLFTLQTKTTVSGTAYNALTIIKLKSLILPLPPLAEQIRIVAKIEELLPKVEEYGKAQEALDKLNKELPERLKKSILQEAIQGRLVPQDPNDEPASVLLDRIRKEKAKLVKEGKLKKKDLEEKPISEEEIPFEIPASWEWYRMGDIMSNQTGLSYNKGDLDKKVDHPIRVLRGGNIQNGTWITKIDDIMIAPEYIKKQNLSLQENTFITPAVTSLEHLGKTALIEENHMDIVAGGFVLYLLPFYREFTFAKYLLCFFQSSFYNRYCRSIANKSGQAFWNLSRQKLMDLAIPLPPLAEQKRIVAKIEQLFNEIDKLK